MATTQEKTNYTLPGEIPDLFWLEALNASNSVQGKADPYLLAAIAKHETNYGTLGAGRQGYALGYGVYSETNQDSRFKDTPGEFTNQLKYAAKQVAAWFNGKPVTEENLKAFMDESWKPGDKNWYKGVWNAYQGINQDIVDQGINQDIVDQGINQDIVDQGLRVMNKSGFSLNPFSGLPEKLTYVVILIIIGLIGVFSLTKIFK